MPIMKHNLLTLQKNMPTESGKRSKIIINNA